jgi:pyruvate dehydrogenase E1 component alpha subunit
MRAAPPPETRAPELLAAGRMRDRDPVTRFEDHLLGRGLVSQDDVRALRESVRRQLEAAVAFAEASPFPDPNDLLVDMFAE